MSCFSITGEYIVNLSRIIWADEHDLDRALGILASAFPEMSQDDKMGILTGKLTLRGDSNTGCELVADTATVSEYGSPLSEVDQIRLSKLENQRLSDENEILSGQFRYVVAKNIGLVKIARSRYADYIDNKISINDIEYELYSPLSDHAMWRRMLAKEALNYSDRTEDAHFRQEIGESLGLIDLYSAPDGSNEITTDYGWLDPTGVFYPCNYMEHAYVARCLGLEDHIADKLGWLKWEPNHPDAWLLFNRASRTQVQLDKAFDYFVKRSLPIPEWLRETEVD